MGEIKKKFYVNPDVLSTEVMKMEKRVHDLETELHNTKVDMKTLKDLLESAQ